MTEYTICDPYGQAAFPIVVSESKKEPNCFVERGQLKCGTCHHRIPTKPHSRYYEPKYPYCHWCGAQTIF